MMLIEGEKLSQSILKDYRTINCLLLISVLTVLIGVSGNMLFAEAPTGKGIIDSLLEPDDKTPPEIELEDLKDNNTAYTEKIYIAGQAIDNNKVAALTLNTIPLSNRQDRSIYFSYLAELNKGKNIISIEARDAAGNKNVKEIIVIRKDPQFFKLPKKVFEKRMRLAVYPFDQKGAVSEESSIFLDMLTLALQHQNRFQLTDRTLMDRILKEQKLSLTQLIDQDTAVKAGRIMSAQAIVTGSIMRTGGGIELVARVIDSETAEILVTEKIHTSKEGPVALNFLAESLAARLHNDFPMAQGMVIQKKGRQIFTDIGQDTTHQRSRLIIYRDNDPGDVILGYAQITQVLPDMSKAELLSGRLDEIMELDRVVVQ